MDRERQRVGTRENIFSWSGFNTNKKPQTCKIRKGVQ